jgi:hypothetical protein
LRRRRKKTGRKKACGANDIYRKIKRKKKKCIEQGTVTRKKHKENV